MNKHLLEYRMRMHGDTQETLARYLGISRSTISTKINEKNNAGFTKREMSKIKDRYNLSMSEFLTIFFEENVSCTDTNNSEAVVKEVNNPIECFIEKLNQNQVTRT